LRKPSIAVLTLLAALAAAPPAAAEGSFGLFGGQFLVESEVDSESRLDVLGLRAGWSVAPRWSVEGSLSWIEEGPVDLYLGDLSLRWTPRPDGRVRFYALGGPGVFHVELDEGVLGDPDDELAVHLGSGVEIDLGRRFVLRPDVRWRWFDDGDDTIHTEATLGLGFRF
jgi:hypothetical protein